MVKNREFRRFTVSINFEDFEALSAIKQQEERSMSWVIGQAIKVYLASRPRQLELPIFRETEGRRKKKRTEST